MRQHLLQWTGNIAILAACFAIGFFGLSYAKTHWMSAQAEPAVVVGDYSAHWFANQPPIVMYGTASCRYCQQARAFFTSHNIDYVDLRIDESDRAKAAYQRLGRRSVPQIIVRDQLISGFNKPAIAAALALPP